MKVTRKAFSELSAASKNEIDRFVENHDGLIFHETAFNEIVSRVYKTDLFYFLAYAGQEMVGICPAHAANDGLLKSLFSSLSFYEIPYGGWIYNERKTSIKSLMASTKIRLNECLFYSSGIQKNGNGYEGIGIDNIARLNTVIIDLSPSVDDLFNCRIGTQQRKKIRRAQKNGITIEKIAVSEMNEFIHLSNELSHKVGLPIRSRDLYNEVMEAYAKDDKAVCLAAKYKGSYISGQILLANRNWAIAWVAGRKMDLPNNLYQNELLFWESMIWAKKTGCRYLDLCGLDEVKLPQLARIKLSFSKEIAHFYAFSKKSFSYKVINRIRKVIRQFDSRKSKLILL